MRYARAAGSSLVVGGVLAAWVGCDQLAGIHEGALGNLDATTVDVGVADSGSDAPHDGPSVSDSPTTEDQQTGDGGSSESSTVDAPVDAPPDVPTVYNDLTNPTFWSTYDRSALDGGAGECEGAAFDGRYVYMACGNVVRYDTHGSFDATSSWSVYDPDTNPEAGVVFDGRFLYFLGATVTRYDTMQPFDTAASWETYVTGGSASAIRGGTFDGKHVYLAGATAYSYDTTQSFTAAASWSSFALNQIESADDTYIGALFDGRFVYLAPQGGNAVRYDTTTGAFTAISGWTTFDTSQVTSGAAIPYFGMSFDGRYVYYSPYSLGTPSGRVTRYDTTMGFGVAASWSLFDTTAISTSAENYTAAGFDGRYLYFLQGYNGGAPGYVAQYDTTAPFAALASWNGVSTAAFNSSAWDFHGSVFDGEFLYMAPNFNSIVARLDCKSPPSTPTLPKFYGSFF